jgi:hypothetical protein
MSMGTSKAIARDKFEETPVQRLQVCTVFPSAIRKRDARRFLFLTSLPQYRTYRHRDDPESDKRTRTRLTL